MRESRTPRGNFAYKKRLIIVFSKICQAICNCEGGGFPQEKHGLSSPAPKAKAPFLGAFVFGMDNTNRREARVEPRTRVSALPAEASYWESWKAKDDIDNVGAGRAAKGATLVACSKTKKRTQGGAFFRFGTIKETKRESNSKGEFCV